MPTFTDNFERGNGALGGNWQTVNGTPSISGGYAGGITGSLAVNSTYTSNTRIKCLVHNLHVTATSVYSCPLVKGDPGVNSGYYATAVRVSTTNYLRIYRRAAGLATLLAETTFAGEWLNYYTLSIEWDMGHLTAKYNESVTLETNDDNFAAYNYAGYVVITASNLIADLVIEAGTSPALSIDPAVIPNYGECTTVSITGSNTDWVAGTPGSPIFTVNHGTISAQTVTDTTHVTLTYCPGDYLGMACFTDPSTGQVICALVSSDPNVVPPVGGLSATAIEYIERSAITPNVTPSILNQESIVDIGDGFSTAQDVLGKFWRTLAQIVDPDGEKPAGSYFLDVLWSIANAHAMPDAEHNILGEATQANINAGLAVLGIAALKSDNYQTLFDVAQNVRYGPGATIENLFTVLGITDTGQWASIVQGLEAILADQQASAVWTADKLTSIQGEGSTSLLDILQALGSLVVNVDLSSVLNKLESMQGTGLNDFSLNQIYSVANGAYGAIEWFAAKQPQGTYAALYNINDIVALLKGASNRDLTEVYNRIGEAVAGIDVDLTPIMNLLTAIRGDDTTTLKKILDAIGQDDEHPNYSTLALLALLALALVGNVPRLTVFLAKLASGKLDLMLDIVSAITDAADFFLDLWTTLKGPQPVKVTNIPPAYPGLEGVVLGEPIPFVDGLNVVLRMDGALIDIATPGEHPYAIKNTQPTRYGRLGTFAFACDEQRLEAIQPIQYLNFLATPKAIVKPTGLVVQCKPGTVGTVIPYLLPE